jgi:hypothetical protein
VAVDSGNKPIIDYSRKIDFEIFDFVNENFKLLQDPIRLRNSIAHSDSDNSKITESEIENARKTILENFFSFYKFTK